MTMQSGGSPSPGDPIGVGAVNVRHLRHISVNYYATATGGNVAVGPVVPAGKRRMVFYVKIWHDSPDAQVLSLFRDGAVGAVPLDDVSLPGSGAGGFSGIGDQMWDYSLNIESPVYILEPGEQLGMGVPVDVNGYILINCYDEP